MPCSVTGCTRLRHHRARYCSMHAERRRLTGTVGPPEPVKRPNRTGSVMRNGYIVLTGTRHPLATAQGKVLVHRLVLFEKIGAGAHPCHWCGRTVIWRAGRIRRDSLVVDHLNDDRADNDPENLVPSCNRCNTNRKRLAA